MTGLAVVRQPLWRGVLLGLACALAAWLVSRPAPVRGLENWAVDWCFQMRSQRPTRANVVLVSIDDRSLDRLRKPLLYLSPEIARVVTYVKSQGTAAIGVDVIIPDSLSKEPEFQRDGRGDANTLGDAVLEAGNVVLAEWRLKDTWVEPLGQWWRRKHLRFPDERDLGFVNVEEDPDHFLRRQKLYGLKKKGPENPGQPVMHFALALYARATGAQVDWDGTRLCVGGQPVPVDDDQILRVNYVGPPGSFDVLSFGDVLDAAETGRPLGRDLAGAIVIIGTTAASQQDLHATPFCNNYFRRLAERDRGLMSGPEFHAHIIATLADRAYIVCPPWLTPVLLLVFGPLLGLVFGRLNLEVGAVVAVIHHFAWKGVCLAAFRYAGWQVEMVPMLVLGFLAYAATFGLRWRLLRGMLGVVQSEAVAKVLEAGGALDRRGAECTITVLFADIRRFTDFSETCPPTEVVALLNAYFGEVVPLIEAHGGTLNKYLGDGLLAFFGAPAAQADHARQGVRAAVAMVRRVHQLKETWAKLGYAGFCIGVGVHTGRVVVGAVGSRRRLEYTAVGDTVNVAARIEAVNTELGTEVLISSETYAALTADERQDLGITAEPHLVRVKGREQPLSLYRVAVP